MCGAWWHGTSKVAGMNAITFEVKQVHVKATAKGVALFKAAAVRWKEELLALMTPARFDLMEAVYLCDEPHHRTRARRGEPPVARWRDMAGLIEVLGLAASTVSRGAKRLAELGLVEVRRTPHDRRYAEVHLTADGLKALALAKKCLEHDPRALPAFREEEEVRRPYRRDPHDERGLNVQTKDLVQLDRIAENFAEMRFQTWVAGAGDGANFVPIMNQHFYRVVDHFRRLGRFFGSRTRPLHDARDVTTFLVHLEGYERAQVEAARARW